VIAHLPRELDDVPPQPAAALQLEHRVHQLVQRRRQLLKIEPHHPSHEQAAAATGKQVKQLKTRYGAKRETSRQFWKLALLCERLALISAPGTQMLDT
jgi:hypothetical protein